MKLRYPKHVVNEDELLWHGSKCQEEASLPYLVGWPVWLVLLAAICMTAGEASGATNEPTLRIACMQSIVSNINRNDALASIRVLGNAVAVEGGIPLKVESAVYNTYGEFKKSVQQEKSDLMIVSVMDYLELEQEGVRLNPLFVPQLNHSNDKEYLMLTSKGKPVTMSELRGKNIIILKTRGVNLGKQWLDVLLNDQHLDGSDKFFGSVKVVDKPSAALLPVFFGKCEACIVNREGFQITNELNPQIGVRLQICTNSPNYIESIICMRPNFQENREKITATLAELHKKPAGEQILSLFTIKKLVPFREESIRAVCQLRDRWFALEGAREP